MNDFTNDGAYLETRWLLQLVQNQGLVPAHLIKITHMSTGVNHIIAILPDGRYICDCCMGLNLGLVCRHYFAAWLKMPGLPFHISLIRARWYQNPKLAVAALNPIIFQDRPTSRLVQFTAKTLEVATVSNLVSSVRAPTLPLPTQTVAQHTVYHTLTAEVRSMTNRVQTIEQQNDLQERLGQVGYVCWTGCSIKSASDFTLLGVIFRTR
ncbi:hypothetical protein B0H10DRAFT_1803648 [Mycena sp. CBHHK59/15]|nr:hypothetical protein B0H10DRAFT_1811470 [Mycena sp. CBHHK59/15]KAJ6614344.1 hypothetical protein B0H10DRAFT_1803648 [Mycena sp. CBHHK59/15]